MSGRKDQLSYQIITNGDMSGNITGPSTNLKFLDNVGFQFAFTGTPTGTFFIDVSIDQVTWTPLSFSSTPVASGAAGSVYIDINQTSGSYMRARYTATGGTGTLNAFITAKQV